MMQANIDFHDRVNQFILYNGLPSGPEMRNLSGKKSRPGNPKSESQQVLDDYYAINSDGKNRNNARMISSGKSAGLPANGQAKKEKSQVKNISLFNGFYNNIKNLVWETKIALSTEYMGVSYKVSKSLLTGELYTSES